MIRFLACFHCFGCGVSLKGAGSWVWQWGCLAFISRYYIVSLFSYKFFIIVGLCGGTNNDTVPFNVALPLFFFELDW